MKVPVTPCRRCKHPAVPQLARRRYPWLRRHGRALVARGLCATCYDAARHGGTLADYERPSLSREDLIEDYLMLRGEGHTARQIADRLGIHVDTLKRALIRAAADGDPRAVHRPGGGW